MSFTLCVYTSSGYIVQVQMLNFGYRQGVRVVCSVRSVPLTQVGGALPCRIHIIRTKKAIVMLLA